MENKKELLNRPYFSTLENLEKKIFKVMDEKYESLKNHVCEEN